MKRLLTEWKKFLNEDQTQIEYKSGRLVDLIKEFPKIKRLRVPAWYLQSVYYSHTNVSQGHGNNKSIASIAFDGDRPVGIAALVREYEYGDPDNKTACLNLFVDSWHRNLGIGSQMFKRVMELSKDFQYIIGSRRSREILEKRGYVPTHRDTNFQDAIVFKNKYYLWS